MKRKIELLAPGGDIDAIKAAILAGANAIYCGLDKFNARNRAANISFEDLQGILRVAHKHHCEVFLTLNIIIVEQEIPALIALLNKLINTGIDGVIIQDFGMFHLLSKYFKSLKIHASTQLTTHNEGQIKFLSKLTATRVNLCRELNIDEIKALTAVSHNNNVLTEVFVHGSYCISFSGICYMSSVHGGNSGNRGRCSQPCRDRYLTTPAGKQYPLNLKDNSAFFNLRELHDAGVDSLKIEGRIKKFDYVYTVVNTWKKQLLSFINQDKLNTDDSDLYKVFNRDFSNAYLQGDISEDMFIDNPRDHSIQHLSEINNYASEEEKEKDQLALYEEKERLKASVENKINRLSIAKAPLTISISGACGEPLKVVVKTPDTSFVVLSTINLANKGTQALNHEVVLKRLQAINDTEYYIEHLDLTAIQGKLFLPFKELTAIKKRVLFILNGSKEVMEPITVPALKKPKREAITPTLSVLIASPADVALCSETTANIYFQLPNCFKNKTAEFIELFSKNKHLIPWFPSVLIGDDYAAAVDFLQQVPAKQVVTNNTGIAYEACKRGIPWIAGPYLNIANSYSLLALKEHFNCSGSFISNELNKNQIKRINKPEDFNLYYSIYHPIVLMTSRQCLLHKVIGCKKNKMDDTCIQQCEKAASITNLNNTSFVIEKTKSNYYRVYNEMNCLNTEIVTDIPHRFTSFFIDLSNIKTATRPEMDKAGLIKLFKALLNGDPDSEKQLKEMVHPTTNGQYKKGI
ncbi:U32 family peptidase [Marinilabiliaceae bacterium JC017]|nr:U32 family peptidase [Marinilabiliaceae bacterium JC017]